jgi:dTDP-glucose 4,6-dehydratase
LVGELLENLIVTGGLGFIGSNFIHHIIHSREDLTITNIDCKGLGSNPANVRELKHNRRYRFVKGDLANTVFTRSALKGARTVVNFAAQTHVDRSIANPEPFFDSNIQGAYNLFQSALKNKVSRLVHISTDEVYGSTQSGSFDENSPLNPSSPYSATKASADLMAHAWGATYKLPVITLRCTNNFGPRQHPEKFIPKTIIRALNGKSIPLYGGGQQVRDWIYVNDFCQAIEQAVEKGTPGEVYNISAGNELTNRDVADRLLKLVGDPSVTVVDVDDRPGHDFRYSLNSEKARRTFGWKPAHSFEEGLGLTVKWYRANPSWWKPLATAKILSDAAWKQRWRA